MEGEPGVLSLTGVKYASSGGYGMVLMHERLFIDETDTHRATPSGSETELQLTQLALVHQFPHSCLTNLRIEAPEDVEPELEQLQDLVGPVMIVHASTALCGRNIRTLRKLAMNPSQQRNAFVLCTGPPAVNLGTSDMIEHMSRELAIGCDEESPKDPPPRAALIALPLYKLDDSQKHSCVAAACSVQTRLNIPLLLQTTYFSTEHDSLVQELKGNRADLSRCILCQMSPRSSDMERLISLLNSGIVICFDTFGFVERPTTGPQFPSDEEACHVVAALVRLGHVTSMLLSHNIRSKMQLRKYGGMGLTHIPLCIIPRLRSLSVSEDEIQKLVAGNALRIMSYYVPAPVIQLVEEERLVCSWCGTSFPASADHFTKFTFTYCGTDCLREHRLAKFVDPKTLRK